MKIVSLSADVATPKAADQMLLDRFPNLRALSPAELLAALSKDGYESHGRTLPASGTTLRLDLPTEK